MEIPTALAADLQSLTAALDRPGTDLITLVHNLDADTERAVPSYLGLRMALLVDDYPFAFTLLKPTATHGTITSSALLPLSEVCGAQPGSVLIFYAAAPGAFVDFAADLSHSLGLALDAVVLDQQLSPPEDQPGRNRLADHSTLNQAIGLLIGRGFTPEAAHQELRQLAARAGDTIGEVARLLIQPPDRSTREATRAETYQRVPGSSNDGNDPYRP